MNISYRNVITGARAVYDCQADGGANIMTTNWKQLCDSAGRVLGVMQFGLKQQRVRYCYVRHVCVIIYLQDVCALVLFEQIQGDSGWCATSGGCTANRQWDKIR